VLGAMWMAFLFGSIAATVASMSSKENYYEDQVDIVTQSMKSIKLEEKRQQEVIQYIELMKENPSVNSKDMDRFF
jgi:prefoldin subunit 5